jgi:hypothetical protein
MAEGPPIDSTGKIRCKFIFVQLDSIQIRHLQTHRWIKLTPIQQKRLHFLNLPKYVDIFDPFHHDCTCGQTYGMWYQTDRLGFCYGDTTKTEINNDEESNEWYNNDTNFVRQSNLNNLFISTNGQLLYKDKPISIDNVPKIINSLKTKKNKKYLTIYQPPTAGNPNSKKIQQTKTKIRQLIPADFEVNWM